MGARVLKLALLELPTTSMDLTCQSGKRHRAASKQKSDRSHLLRTRDPCVGTCSTLHSHLVGVKLRGDHCDDDSAPQIVAASPFGCSVEWVLLCH
jgi:hypothetical protein